MWQHVVISWNWTRACQEGGHLTRCCPPTQLDQLMPSLDDGTYFWSRTGENGGRRKTDGSRGTRSTHLETSYQGPPTRPCQRPIRHRGKSPFNFAVCPRREDRFFFSDTPHPKGEIVSRAGFIFRTCCCCARQEQTAKQHSSTQKREKKQQHRRQRNNSMQPPILWV